HGDAEQAPARPFRDYVMWVQAQQPSRDAEAFWRRHLDGVAARAASGAFRNLPFAWLERRRGAASRRRKTDAFDVPQELRTRLTLFGRRKGLTLATLFYAAWAVLQARLQRSDEVLFTTTSSGRWADLDRMSDIVGPVFATQPFHVDLRSSGGMLDWLIALQT